jgi:thiosulfate/3-mercaptopyruvate sulfurtransferase
MAVDRPNPIISAEELRDELARGNCRIVDCRFDLADPEKGRALFDEAHIDGAVFDDLDKDLADPVSGQSGRHPLPDVATFCRKLGAWGISNATKVVAYDHGNGATAGRLWWLLRWLGHADVSVLDGGFAAWQAAGGAISIDQEPIEAVEFVGTPDSSMVATTGEILGLVQGSEPYILVDARDPGRFRGDVEPIDPVAGRIPGSINMPFPVNLGPDGHWRPADDLRREWRKLLVGRPDSRPVVMCGSGVTACHLIIAAELAELPLPRLYVGSWSEWIRDPGRPVKRGE